MTLRVTARIVSTYFWVFFQDCYFSSDEDDDDDSDDDSDNDSDEEPDEAEKEKRRRTVTAACPGTKLGKAPN